MRGGRPWGQELVGRIEEHDLHSPALVGNPLGDPSDRPLLVQLPPGYDDDPAAAYPSLYLLQGFAGMLGDWPHRRPFSKTTPELVDEAFVRREAPLCIVVWVDAWTRLGGSQFVDSGGTGNYQRYLCHDVVDFVDAHYRTRRDSAHRGVIGLSSGGCGAALAAMSHPEVFGAFASHAGDAAFELSLLPDLAAAYRILRDRYDRSFAAWCRAREAPEFEPATDEFALVLVHALAACYSPDPTGAPTLPFRLSDGALIPEVWQRWRDYDPIVVASRHGEALRSLRAVFLDAGRNDEYRLDLATEQFAAVLRALGAPVHLELFDGTHAGLARRYPRSVAHLARALA